MFDTPPNGADVFVYEVWTGYVLPRVLTWWFSRD
jgi:hypothetical protein